MDKYNLLDYLTILEMSIIKEKEEINELFDGLGEQKNAWYYTNGYLDALKTIKDYIKGDKQYDL